MPAKLIDKKLVLTRRKAVTITEVVMASALLIAAIVPILKALATSHSVTARMEQKTKSLTLAQAKMDLIRAQSINNYDSSFTQNNISLASNYYCDVTDSSVSSDLRQITVAVGFDDDSGSDLDNEEVDVELVTLVAKRAAE